jgi:hypothetical protein
LSFWSVVAVAVACGCGVKKPVLPAACENGGCPPEVTTNGLFQAYSNGDLDVLIVVDDTTVLASGEEALAAGFLKAGQILGPGGLLPRDRVPAAHVAVVPGARLPNGAPAPASRAAECGIVAPGQFLTTDKCGRAPNTTRPFGETLACLGARGHESTAPFEPFAAVRRTLAPDGLAALLRPDAALMVLIVAGQDDASSVEISALVAFLKGLKSDPYKVLVSVVGPPTSCPDGGTELPAPRLQQLVQAFGSNGIYVPLCEDSAFYLAFQRLVTAGSHWPVYGCLSRVFDTDPTVAGLQPDCVVTDFTYPDGADGRVETPLPSCEQGAPPCWRVLDEPRCPPGEVAFEIDRGPDWCLQDGFSSYVSCRTCTGAKDPACKSY